MIGHNEPRSSRSKKASAPVFEPIHTRRISPRVQIRFRRRRVLAGNSEHGYEHEGLFDHLLHTPPGLIAGMVSPACFDNTFSNACAKLRH